MFFLNSQRAFCFKLALNTWAEAQLHLHGKKLKKFAVLKLNFKIFFVCVILQIYKIQCRLFMLGMTVYAGGDHSQVKKDQAETFKAPVIFSEFRRSSFGSSSAFKWYLIICNFNFTSLCDISSRANFAKDSK